MWYKFCHEVITRIESNNCLPTRFIFHARWLAKSVVKWISLLSLIGEQKILMLPLRMTEMHKIVFFVVSKGKLYGYPSPLFWGQGQATLSQLTRTLTCWHGLRPSLSTRWSAFCHPYDSSEPPEHTLSGDGSVGQESVMCGAGECQDRQTELPATSCLGGYTKYTVFILSLPELRHWGSNS